MFIDLCLMAFAALRANVLRSCLTMLGVVIGVASIVAVVSVMDALSRSIMTEFEGFGPNTLRVEPYTDFDSALQGMHATLSHEDTDAIRYGVDGVSDITPLYVIRGEEAVVQSGSRNTNTTIRATTSNYSELHAQYVEQGRFITEYDDERARPIAVLGQSVLEKLELKDDPIGSFVQLGQHAVKVVGVMEAKGAQFGLDQDDFVIIPYETGKRFLGQLESPQFTISFSVDRSRDLDRVVTEVERVLRQRRGLSDGDPANFRVQTSEEIRESFSQITNIVTAALIGVVAISLFVGGVGIMNIMLVSVTERTREIGIVKALGAKRWHILTQFLMEAVTISLVGGAIGLLFGFGIGYFFGVMVGLEVILPFWAVLLAFGFSFAVGIVFGVLPAVQAANLKTIDALRYE